MLLSERIQLFQEVLAHVQTLSAEDKPNEAVDHSLQALTQVIPKENLSHFISPSFSIQALNIQLQGILIERCAFYQQLENSEHWFCLSRTSK